MTTSEEIARLPVYESTATPEGKEEQKRWMAKQYALILDQQERIETPSKYVKIRCGCNKLVSWIYMYRCLYCGVWFCKECAQLHFGKRVPESVGA